MSVAGGGISTLQKVKAAASKAGSSKQSWIKWAASCIEATQSIAHQVHTANNCTHQQ
jgi:hypothetical protein